MWKQNGAWIHLFFSSSTVLHLKKSSLFICFSLHLAELAGVKYAVRAVALFGPEPSSMHSAQGFQLIFRSINTFLFLLQRWESREISRSRRNSAVTSYIWATRSCKGAEEELGLWRNLRACVVLCGNISNTLCWMKDMSAEFSGQYCCQAPQQTHWIVWWEMKYAAAPSYREASWMCA